MRYNNRKYVNASRYRSHGAWRLALFLAAALLAVSTPAAAGSVFAVEASAPGAAGSGGLSYAEEVGAASDGGLTLAQPEGSFRYRYEEIIAERAAEAERQRIAAEEAARAAAEAKRLEENRNNIAGLSAEELEELYSNDYFYQRLRDLGHYRDEYGDSSVNLRNGIIRFQASINYKITGTLDLYTKKALVENSPVTVTDSVSSPASSGYWITINKSRNILTVYKGSGVYKKYPVATGASAGLTPEGKFSFVTKAKNPAWGGGGYASPVAGGSPSNPLGYRWLGLSVGGGGSYGVHGNAAPKSIGTYASHGCVRMINADVEAMYEYIPIGTPVWIGTDSKLKEYGVSQYNTMAEPKPVEPEPEPEPTTEPAPDPSRAQRIEPATTAPAPAAAVAETTTAAAPAAETTVGR